MTRAFVGVDVACAKDKVLPICIVAWQEGQLIPFPLRRLGISPPRGAGNVAALDEALVREFALDTAQYLRDVARELDLEIARIAIDAPQAPANGLHQRRDAELALDAAGISCFSTPSREGFEKIQRKVRMHLEAGGSEGTLPHSNQLWMMVGFVLFEELAKIAPCLEVFPQATVRAIGAGQVHKSRVGAVDAQLRAAAEYTGWPGMSSGDSLRDCVWGSPHDQLDAYLSAWVAALDESQRRAMGQLPDDAIWVPMTDSLENRTFPESREDALTETPQPSRRDSRRKRNTALRVDDTLVCPACNEHTYQRWPWGWDAHPAHRCTGLLATDPVERKVEYRTRYAHLFRR